MGEPDAVNAVPIVGGPLAFGLALAALLLAVFANTWAGAIVTVAHEAGHMVLAVLTFRGLGGFRMQDDGSAGTYAERYHWSVSDLATAFAGYPMPSLLGLGGAYLIADGRPAGVLWVALVLLFGAMTQARNALAYTVTVLEVLGVGWAVFAGNLAVQAAVAVGLVWLLLIGGAYDSTINLSRADGSDAERLARRTWVPRIVWHALWAAIAVVCLWNGGGRLLGLG